MYDAQDPMNTDELEEQTQQATQSTEQACSQALRDVERHLWGYFQPCSSRLRRIDFFKLQPVIHVGRHDQCDVILPGAKVSNRHCRLVWDGVETEKAAVVVADTSSNGTFINGIRIGKDKTAVLRDGNEIAFGTPLPQVGSYEDYRFIFRLTAGGTGLDGVHAYYDITHELGKGSFATVMKAVSRQTGQWFAIKMIHESKVRRATVNEKSEEEKESAFMREIAILEDLDHPNICKLKEVFRNGGKIDLVLEYIDGGDLLDYILKNDGLSEPMAIHITKQLCDALAYIHAKGIAHRDLKPENVLLTSHDPPIVKVADFGLAKVVDSITFLKTMCGTPGYLAPEVVMQTDQQQGYSHLVDSWSVGVIVFCMLTSSNPFIEDEKQRDMKARIATRTVDWKTLHRSRVSDLAQDFIRRLLESDPRKRLSLSAARSHPWLNQISSAGIDNHRGFQGTTSVNASPSGSSLTSFPDEDEAMDDLASQPSMSAEMEQLQLGQNQSSRSRAPLQRRSQVLAEAAENNVDLPDPCWQILDTAGAGPARAGKRKLNEHDSQAHSTTMEEENTAPPRRGARKKGKQTASSDAEESPTGGEPPTPAPVPPKRGGGAGRGRGRGRDALSPEMRARLYEAVAASGMVIEEDHLDDGTAPPRPRRTTRKA